MPSSTMPIIEAIREADFISIAEHISSFGVNQPLIAADGADLNILHIAAGVDSNHREKVVEYILNQKDVQVDTVSGPGNENWTAAHIAACWGYHRTLDLLLKHGADPFLTDVNGLNVWDVARVYDNFNCVYVLENRMNRTNADTILILDEGDDEDDRDSIASNESATAKTHVDKKFGLVFVEEKAVDLPDIAEAVSRGPATIDDSICALDDSSLRRRLIQSGESPGPVVASTRQFYQRRLQRLASAATSQPPPDTSQVADSQRSSPRVLSAYPPEINSVIDGKFDFVQGRKLHKELIEFFAPDSSKSFFNYLLIDPRICFREGRPSATVGANTTFDTRLFKSFIKSIFYIGKGHGRRPLMHLYEAALQNRTRNERKKTSAKCDRILDIWKEEYGVISLHCFQSISSQEALARECLMIEALGLTNLTNIQIGHNRTKLLRWNEGKRRLAGSFLLFNSYWIFCAEGHNQIRMTDVRF